MTTLYDIGDKIKVTLDGKVIGYSASNSGDCYTIELIDPKHKGNRVYLSGEELRGNSCKIKNFGGGEDELAGEDDGEEATGETEEGNLA